MLQVSRAFNFKQVCQRSDTNLRQLFLNSTATSSVGPVCLENREKDNSVIEASPNQVVLNYENANGTTSKCMNVVGQMTLLDSSDNQMLGMTVSDEIIGSESECEDNQMANEEADESETTQNDISDLVSSLPLQDNDQIINEFGKF